MVKNKSGQPKLVHVFDCTLRPFPSGFGENELAVIDCIEEVTPETPEPRVDVYV